MVKEKKQQGWIKVQFHLVTKYINQSSEKLTLFITKK